MPQYKSPLVSCCVCREVKSAKGLHGHFLVMHTTEERYKRVAATLNRKSNDTTSQQNLGSLAWSKKASELRACRQTEYNACPKRCLHCLTTIPFALKNNKFCSHNCSATYNNSRRAPRSVESKLKTSVSAKALVFEYSKIQFCVCGACHRQYVYGSPLSFSKRFCTSDCRSKFMSIKMSQRLSDPQYRKNYGRGKKSYLEESFENWLKAHSVVFETEVHFKNHELKKNYIVDFFFRDLQLIIELDGSQHLKTVEKDKIRDEYITRTYGLTILRISHREYQKKIKIDQVRKLLGI